MDGWTALFNQTDSSGISNAIRALDAFGKLGAGYLRGNRYALGDYDECFSLPSTQYCLSDLILRLGADDLPDPELYYAICLPRGCTVNDTTRAISAVNNQLDFFNITIEISSVSCERETKTTYNAGAIIVILVWVIIGVTIVGFTIFYIALVISGRRQNVKGTAEISTDTSINTEPTKRSNTKGTVQKFVSAGSLFKSVSTLLSTDSKSREISCLDGLKVVSLCWIILGNTHLWSLFYDSHTTHIYRNVVTRFSYQAVIGSLFGFDSLFLLSGVLVAYVTLGKISDARKNSGRRYVAMATEFLRRVLHFVPVYAVVLFTIWLLTVHFADGPLWHQTVGVGSILYENCQKNWWTNFFNINNLYPWASLDQCMPWAWYVASELQFFIFAPLIIVPLAFLYPLGLAITGGLLFINIIILGALTGHYNLSASIFLDLDLTRPISDDDVIVDGHNSIDDIHTKPWARIGPFLLGIVLGFILFRKWKLKFGCTINMAISIALWFVASGLCFATVYGSYGAFDDLDGSGLTEGEAIVYQMFSRIIWALGVSTIIFLCHNGYGGFINSFFSMKFWVPLSRLSILVYLIHPVVLFVLFYTRRAPVYSTDVTLAAYTIAAVALSYAAAAFVAVFVDFPLRNLEETLLDQLGLGSGQKKDAGINEEDDEEDVEDKVVGHENIYFRELEKEDEKRLEAEQDERDGAETDTVATEKTEKTEI